MMTSPRWRTRWFSAPSRPETEDPLARLQDAEAGRLPGTPGERLAYLDALRGYAILMVIAVHATQYAQSLPQPVLAVTAQGARGVQLFFVISALALMISWHKRNDGAVPFYLRRFFRIAPMFWLGIAFFAGLAWWRTGDFP
jgi:peptidoglycan/LPS O-acetylase OafA/YrhL